MAGRNKKELFSYFRGYFKNKSRNGFCDSVNYMIVREENVDYFVSLLEEYLREENIKADLSKEFRSKLNSWFVFIDFK